MAAFARRAYEKHVEDARKDRPGAVHVSKLFERFEEDYVPGLSKRSQRIYKDALDRFRLFYVKRGGDPLVRDMDAGDVDRYLSWRRWHAPDGSKRKKPLSGHTLQKDRSVLSCVFGKAVDWRHREANPVLRTDPPKADDRNPVILDADQYEKLLKEAKASRNPMAYLYVLLLGETGLRSDSEAPMAPVGGHQPGGRLPAGRERPRRP